MFVGLSVCELYKVTAFVNSSLYICIIGAYEKMFFFLLNYIGVAK